MKFKLKRILKKKRSISRPLKNYAKEKVKNFKRSKYDGIMIDDNETEFKLQFRGNSYSESDGTDYTITYEIKEVEQI